MRSFKGRGGTVSLLGEPHRFVRLPLLDQGDGWDWRAPDGMSYWLDQKLTVEYWDEGWKETQPESVCRQTGHVSLGRSLSHVVATGHCLTSAVECEAERWELVVPMVLKNTTVMGAEHATSRVGRTAEPPVVVLYGAVCREMQTGLVTLPVSRGALIGVGKVRPIHMGVEVQFNSEGVTYGPC